MNEKENVRIQNFLAKVRRGEPVTVAVLGGSITTGYNAQPISKNSWASRTETWLKDLAAKNLLSSKKMFEPRFCVSANPQNFLAASKGFYALKKLPELVSL